MKFLPTLSLLFLLITSCKTLQKTTTQDTQTQPESTTVNTVALAHKNANFNANTLQAKLETLYDDGDKQQSITIKLRIEKDKVIWMSGTFLGIPMAKILITPHRIQYYEKINKTYFDGDFSLFEKTFGVPLSFTQIQNLLLGQAFFGTDNTKLINSNTNLLLLVPNNQNPKFDLFYFINPQHFKLEKQQARVSDNEYFTVSYNSYQTIDNQIIPENIKVFTTKNNENTTITFDIKNVELNQSLSFPFDMPEGYEKLNFEK